jgi:hypothetical protein
MILLLNLNAYIGGGETLLIRMAQHLHSTGRPYQIMAAAGDCWIAREAARLGLECQAWPARQHSITYQSNDERTCTVAAMEELFGNRGELRIFTFCMRDLYNALYVFTRMPRLRAWFAHGIYHPEDVRYLSSLSFCPARIVGFNRRLARSLYDARAILFVNRNGLNESLCNGRPCSEDTASAAVFAPLPIAIAGGIPERRLPPMHAARKLRIICISRFVVFKVGAVLAIMRHVRSRDDAELLVIGHGRWKLVLDAWMLLRCARNIRILTDVGPAQLDAHIDSCDVGYAQGTSILEIAKRGVPVLIAPYSRIRDVFNRRFPTLGIFGDTQDASAFGDVTDLRGVRTYAIAERMATLERDYAIHQKRSSDFVRTFAAPVVCGHIEEFVRNSGFSNQRPPFLPPRAPLLKRMMKALFRLES